MIDVSCDSYIIICLFVVCWLHSNVFVLILTKNLRLVVDPD